jgi:hypothetical protein
MGKVLCSLGAGRQRRLLALAERSFRPYAQRHGYTLDLRTDLIDTSRPPAWSKVALIRELLARHETVVWLDADTIVVRGDRDIAAELPDGRFLGLVEHRVDGRANPNTGVMVIRSGDDARNFFSEVWDSTRFLNHRWWEQAAVMELLGYDPEGGESLRESEWQRGVQRLDKSWNSIRDDPAAEPRIRHWPGYTVPRRFAEMAWALVTSRR